MSDEEVFSFLTSTRKPQIKNKYRPKAKTSKDEFLAASVLADAYDGFDIMDFDRPSLKKKQKARKGRLAFDLSDSELENAMQLTWDHDRLKKRDKKIEREELRRLGLLGKNTKPDLRTKYKEGVGIQAMKGEIRDFLKSGHTTWVAAIVLHNSTKSPLL